MQEIGNSQICGFVQSREGKGRVHRADIRVWLGLCDFTVLGKRGLCNTEKQDMSQASVKHLVSVSPACLSSAVEELPATTAPHPV